MFKDKKVWISNLVMFILILAMDICLLCFKNLPYIFKTTASVLFVILGIINFIFVFKLDQRKSLFKYFMLLGLVFACLGDIVLIDYFIYGAMLFAIGHVFFFVSYSILNKINWKDLVISLAIFAVALIIILALPIFDYKGMLPIVIVYALIISFMLGKAISNYVFMKEYKIENLIIMIGSLLFFLSDLMLLFNVFGVVSEIAHEIFDNLCLILYYPAEFVLASSIYYSNIKLEDVESHNKK